MAEHASLAPALVAALADLTVLEAKRTAKIETNKGRDYSYKFADIGDAVKLTRPALAAHGIVALTPVHDHGDGLACTVILLHTSGERLDLGPFPFPHGRDAQATGSMVTYHRRYALIAALGMAAGDDDDGAAAQPRQSRGEVARKPTPFDLAAFKNHCATNELDPLDVVAYAALDKSLGELSEADRPALKSAIEAMTSRHMRAEGPSESAGAAAGPADSGSTQDAA